MQSVADVVARLLHFLKPPSVRMVRKSAIGLRDGATERRSIIVPPERSQAAKRKTATRRGGDDLMVRARRKLASVEHLAHHLPLIWHAD
jgi:hypothetical protein